jgi:hypothetical protein
LNHSSIASLPSISPVKNGISFLAVCAFITPSQFSKIWACLSTAVRQAFTAACVNAISSSKN